SRLNGYLASSRYIGNTKYLNYVLYRLKQLQQDPRFDVESAKRVHENVTFFIQSAYELDSRLAVDVLRICNQTMGQALALDSNLTMSEEEQAYLQRVILDSRYQLSKQELPPFASCFARKDDWHSFNKPINEDKICNWLNNRARADEFSSLVSKYDDCLT